MARSDLAQLVRYGVTAGSVAILYIFVYWLGLQAGLHYLLAILIAQVCAIAIAFPTYRAFVFVSTGTIGSDFIKFLGVWGGGAVAGFVATPFLVEVVRMDPLWAQVLAILTISVASFLSHRFFTFRRRRQVTAGPDRVDEPRAP